MKLVDIVKSLIPVLAFALAFYAGFQAHSSHGQVQSGWMMMCMFALAITVIGLHLTSNYSGWDGPVIAMLCVLCACAFGIHYFGGDQGVRELIRWLNRVYQQISRVHADTFY